MQLDIDWSFDRSDLFALSEFVQQRWTKGADRDWTAPAGTLDWSCKKTADHAVDCTFAPAFFLAAGHADRFPNMGADYTVGADPEPEQFVEALGVATAILAAVIADADVDRYAPIWFAGGVTTSKPAGFFARGALELILHAHDVCAGLGVAYEPPADLCGRLRADTATWPMWDYLGAGLPDSGDSWFDLLAGSGRQRVDNG